MLKKYKILMVIIVLSLTGIITVISIWLYGSYSYRLDMAVNEVERSLFNSVQTYYYQHSDNLKQKHRGYYRNLFNSELAQALAEEYKGIDSTRVQAILDSLAQRRFLRFNPKEDYPKADDARSRSIVPPFVLEQIDFDEETVTSIDSLLDKSLEEKGLSFIVDVSLVQLNRADYRKFKPKVVHDSIGVILTRPILVNPGGSEYLRARFDEPVYYILGKMFWQLLVAVLLIFGLIGTFTYLFWTINRQNKLALLRKSFVNNMTHELKTPVSTVTAAIEAVMRYGARGDQQKTDKYLTISQHELVHLSNMIDKVLQLDIDEVNGLVLELRMVNLNELILEAIELGKLISSKPIDIKFEQVGEGDVYLNADESHLKNVLNNLLDNAIKYSKENVDISFLLYKTDKQVCVEVKDQGIGIPGNYLKDVFDMFFRVPNGEIHAVKGFGLGLAYVKQVVDRHTGQIEVRSEFGKGTSFIIKLPA